jgi:CubicO group peptidase (beta-lactamase class C family)
MKKAIWTILGILLIISCKSYTKNTVTNNSSQNKKTLKIDKEDEWISKKVDSTLKINSIPALSIGIIRNGKLSYYEGFGFKERGINTKVNENSLYQIGSDTKKFTAIIVMNLVSEDKMKLNESIVTYLPNSITNMAKSKLKNITIKTLLLHRSGIPYIAPSIQRIDGDSMLIEYTEKDLVKDLNEIKLEFEPDTDFGYTNFGYAIIGYLCENSSGLEYAALVKKYIAEKYNMKNTFIFPNNQQLSSIVTPYRKDDRNIKSQPWKMGKMTPAGGVYSSISDLSKLMIAQIEAYREFYESGSKDNPLILTENGDIEGSHYGFGMGKTVDETGTRYGHGGDLDGYASAYVFLPKKI